MHDAFRSIIPCSMVVAKCWYDDAMTPGAFFIYFR